MPVGSVLWILGPKVIIFEIYTSIIDFLYDNAQRELKWQDKLRISYKAVDSRLVYIRKSRHLRSTQNMEEPPT